MKAYGLEHYTGKLGHVIPAGGVPRRWSRKRVLLVGDAAGFVDTISGEGIGYAIKSGTLAASAIASARESGFSPRMARKTYRAMALREIQSPLMHSLAFCGALIVARRCFFSMDLDMARGVFTKLFEVMAARRTYQSFVRWSALRLPLPLLAAFPRSFRKPRSDLHGPEERTTRGTA